MNLLFLIKDLSTNTEIIGMFLFLFIVLFVIFRDAKGIITMLRKIIALYMIIALLFNY